MRLLFVLTLVSGALAAAIVATNRHLDQTLGAGSFVAVAVFLSFGAALAWGSYRAGHDKRSGFWRDLKALGTELFSAVVAVVIGSALIAAGAILVHRVGALFASVIFGLPALVSYWAGKNARSSFRRKLKALGPYFVILALSSPVVMLVGAAREQWVGYRAKQERFRAWFRSACGAPISVDETDSTTTRCYKCKTWVPAPEGFEKRVDSYGGPSAFAAGVRVCTSEE